MQLPYVRRYRDIDEREQHYAPLRRAVRPPDDMQRDAVAHARALR